MVSNDARIKHPVKTSRNECDALRRNQFLAHDTACDIIETKGRAVATRDKRIEALRLVIDPRRPTVLPVAVRDALRAMDEVAAIADEDAGESEGE